MEVTSTAMTKEQVKDYVLKNMKTGRIFWLSDIAMKLKNVDLLTIREAVQELKAEGKLKTPEKV